MAKAKSPVPQGFHTVTPQLTLDDAAQAIDRYKKAFGAEEVSRADGPDGKIMHAELRIGDSHVMMNDAMMDGKGPKAIGGSPASLWIYVEDCDALFNRAVAAGGQVSEGRWGRCRINSGATAPGRSPIRTVTPGQSRRARTDLTPQEIQQRQAEFMKQFAGQATDR